MNGTCLYGFDDVELFQTPPKEPAHLAGLVCPDCGSLAFCQTMPNPASMSCRFRILSASVGNKPNASVTLRQTSSF